MYAFIEGRVCEKTTNSLVLEAGGIGYQLNCSMTTLQEAPPMGEKMRCYTYLSVREDAMELFGFATKEEKQLFLSLTGISGVGAKTALGLLGAMPLRDLNLAILLGDVNALSRAPGIGKKTAQRIVLELKDKVEQQDVSAPAGSAAPVSPVVGDAQREAQAALQALGYTSAEAARAINLVRDQADTVDALIMLALRQIGSL
mgnify:CR=1 FL=1